MLQLLHHGAHDPDIKLQSDGHVGPHRARTRHSANRRQVDADNQTLQLAVVERSVAESDLLRALHDDAQARAVDRVGRQDGIGGAHQHHPVNRGRE
jgi:hypothetical protein